MLHVLSSIAGWLSVSFGAWLDRWAHFSFLCSILSLLLPPVEQFQDFPRFQKRYTLCVSLIAHWGALNLRGKLLERSMTPEQKLFTFDKPTKEE